MFEYHLRIHRLFDEVMAWLAMYGCTGLGIKETAEREHIHFAIKTPQKMDTFRKAFKRQFPELLGNADYSLESARDWEKLLRYICKGEIEGQLPNVVWRYGLYADEHIRLYHNQYWVENGVLQARKEAGKTGNMFALLEKRCREKRLAWNNRDEITEVYADVVKDCGKSYDINLARRTIRGVMLQLCPNDSYRKEFVDITWY